MRKGGRARAFLLALVAGAWEGPPTEAADAPPIPPAISQSSAYALVMNSVKSNLCGRGADVRRSMRVSPVKLATGTTLFVISSEFGGTKCGSGEIAAAVADGRGGYRTALIAPADGLDVFPDGRASLTKDVGGDPGFRLTTYRYDGAVYRETATCFFVTRPLSLEFVRGSPSTTVNGRLGPASGPSSIYALSARAGQTMAVVLHGLKGPLPGISITDDRCDTIAATSKSSWRVTLPNSGHVYITLAVPLHSPESTYTMTVSIA